MKSLMFHGVALVLVWSSTAFGQVALESFPQLNAQRDWPWWRGASRDGQALSQQTPTEFSEQKNLDWSQPILGRGHGSPVVVGDRVFLLTADEEKQIHYALACDRNTGKLLWQVEVNRSGFPAKNHVKNTEASPTIACDGERVFMALYHHDAIWVTALSLDGQEIWKKELGRYSPGLYQYGYAASPVLYGDTVIMAYEYDGPSAMVALRRDTGQEVWRLSRTNTITFSSPGLSSHQGKDYLTISGANKVIAYDPANGQQLWQTTATTLATCGTTIQHQGLVFASGGFPGSETVALDVVTGDVAWRNRIKAYEQSLLVVDGYLYSYADGGVLYCWEAKTGKEMWKKRLIDRISASGVRVDDKIYWACEDGTMFVFRARPDQYEELGRNKIGDEAFASPAICGGQIFLRVAKHESDRRQEFLLRFSQQ
ncbi:MAG TPA: dehydrogenase [Planctomycetaceae bacterium]|nr:dehydrogenase [Planctomycetaceae bacterium]